MDLLNYCLMSDAEYEKIPQGKGPRRMDQWLVRYDFDRRRVIQFLGERLDRFSLQPSGS